MLKKTKYQAKCAFKKGEEVIVITGKCSGQSAKVERLNKKSGRVYVTGLNISKRHTKPGAKHSEGGIVDKVMSIHMSNVMLLDPKKRKPTKVGHKMEGEKKLRFSKVSGTILS